MGKDLIHEVKDGVSHLFNTRSSSNLEGGLGHPGDKKDDVIAALLEETRALRATVTTLQEQVDHGKNGTTTYYASDMAVKSGHKLHEIPKRGLPAKFVAGLIEDIRKLLVCDVIWCTCLQYTYTVHLTTARFSVCVLVYIPIDLSDFNPRLNTSSYVNVVSEEEERRVAQIGAEIK